MTVKVTIDKTAMMRAAIKALTKDRVLVGIAADHAFREPEPDDENSELNNAEIGYIQEFGSPEANIPARPHLVPGVNAATPKITEIYKAAGTKALSGDIAGIAAAHGKVGFTATSAVKNLITDGIDPPLAEATLEKRRARGRTGETPLLDTGQYRRNIDFAIAPANTVKNRTRS